MTIDLVPVSLPGETDGLLRAAEASLLRRWRGPLRFGSPFTLSPAECAIIVSGLEDLARLRTRNLQRAAGLDDQPDDGDTATDLDGVRASLRLELIEASHTRIARSEFVGLVNAYVKLGGDLELSPAVPAEEYAAQAAQLRQAERTLSEALTRAGEVLGAAKDLTGDDFTGRFEQLGEAIRRLGAFGEGLAA